MTASGNASTADAGVAPTRPSRASLIRRAWSPKTVSVLIWTKRDLEALYRRSALQVFWAAIQPILIVGVYALIYGVIFDQDGGPVPYLTYLLSGMVIFRTVVLALAANTCLSDNYDVIAHAEVSCEVIPIARVAGNLPDVAITTLLLIIIGGIQGVELHLTIVFLPLVLLLAIILATAAGIIVSTIQVFVRDLQFAIPLITQAMFFASPIAYNADQLPSWLSWLGVVNPISVLIEALRNVAIEGVQPPWFLLGLHGLIALGLLAGSIAHLRSIQHRIVDLG